MKRLGCEMKWEMSESRMRYGKDDEEGGRLNMYAKCVYTNYIY